MTMFTSYKAILLWGVETRTLVNDTQESEQICTLSLKKLCLIICSNSFHSGWELILNKIQKIINHKGHI